MYMAIVEKVGKDRRGNPIYKKDEDGAELLFEHTKKWLAIDDKGRLVVRERVVRQKDLDDDLPTVSENYRKFLEGNL